MTDPIVELLSHQYDFPEHLEFDTFDYCNLNCSFCYLHNAQEESNRLPLHLVERLLQQTVDRRFQSIRPWMNGDPLFEDRLPKIIEIIRKYNSSPIHLFTNGTNYHNRHLLTNPEISEVHFTISASTSKTYTMVHGRPLHKQALRTLEWFERHKHSHQRIFIQFVITKQNIHELEEWKQQFSRFNQIVSPLHRNARDSQLTDDIFIDAVKLGTWKGYLFGLPCILWNNMAVSAKGDFLQCCEASVDYSYGNIAHTPLPEAWRRRCRNKMQNRFCQTCNVRAPDWKMKLDFLENIRAYEGVNNKWPIQPRQL